ncbi:MAG: phosphate regulon sensor histidine kinase PhoR [Pseudomonadota bacterium]
MGAWRYELAIFFGTISCAVMLGSWLGLTWQLVATVLVGYILWHLTQAYRLLRWLKDSKHRYPPESEGIWGDIFYLLFKQQQRNSRRQHDLLSIISQFKASTAALPEGAIVLGEFGEILWFNRSAKKLLGLSPAKDNGQRLVNLVRNPSFVSYVSKGDYSRSIEFPSSLNNEVILSVNITPYKGKQRLIMVRDVTRISKLEQIRKDFIANASHELRSPLTVISGYLETIGDSVSDFCPRYEKPVQQMIEQAQRMKSIVDNLLFLSKLENVKLSEFNEVVDIAALTETIIKEARSLAPEKQLDIDSKIASNQKLRGSSLELYSAFSNLVFNAVRYTPAHGHIQITWTSLAANSAEFSVTDDGIGIEAHHLPRLTERFYRVDDGRSREMGGTGLGLAIVKHVLERHHSALEIESVINQGSRFSCKFLDDKMVIN